jgi:hypothetical protein
MTLEALPCAGLYVTWKYRASGGEGQILTGFWRAIFHVKWMTGLDDRRHQATLTAARFLGPFY